MRRLFLTVIFFGLLLTGDASAQDGGAYVGAEGGLLFRSNGDSSAGYGAALGYSFGNGLRTEVDSFYARVPIKVAGSPSAEGHADTTTVMLSGLYGFGPGALQPYLGAGLGLEDVNARVPGSDDHAWVTAYQVRGGVSYGFSRKLFGSIEYRWQAGQMPKLSLSGIPAKLEIKRHGIVLGLNYHL